MKVEFLEDVNDQRAADIFRLLGRSVANASEATIAIKRVAAQEGTMVVLAFSDDDVLMGLLTLVLHESLAGGCTARAEDLAIGQLKPPEVVQLISELVDVCLSRGALKLVLPATPGRVDLSLLYRKLPGTDSENRNYFVIDLSLYQSTAA